MKRITVTLTILLLFAASLSARASDTETPFSQVITGSCILEDIAVVGIVHTSVKLTQVGENLRIDIRDKVTGEATGLQSGFKYQVSGRTTQRFIITSEALESFTYKSGFALVGPGPDNNLTINYIFKQTPEGVIVDQFSASCK